MKYLRIYILICISAILLLSTTSTNGQQTLPKEDRLRHAKDSIYIQDSVITLLLHDICKGYTLLDVPLTKYLIREVTTQSLPISIKPEPQKKKWLTVHGNIAYELNYRSNMDTPYRQHDIYQHTIQTYLDITVKDAYPVRLYFTNRFGNSRYFPAWNNLNLQYSPHQFANKLQQNLLNNLAHSILFADTLQKVKQLLLDSKAALARLKNLLPVNALIQRKVEQLEKLYLDSLRQVANKNISIPQTQSPANRDELLKHVESSVKALEDSATTKYLSKTLADANIQKNEIESYENKLDSLQAQIQFLNDKYDAITRRYHDQQKILKQLSFSSLTPAQLKQKLAELHVPDTLLPKGYKTLLAIKSLGIGRTVVNYSELSAKNLSINGFQAEYNPSYYVAVATGIIDYRFRDYVLTQQAPKQYATIVRAGWGTKDHSNIIVSYYTGTRQLYNGGTTVNGNAVPNYRLNGITIEANYTILPGTVLTGEFAKSSAPYYKADSLHSLLSQATDLTKHANEAYSFKVQSYIKYTNTKLTATYKQYGANFQSFSYFSNGNREQAWMLQADQTFFAKKLTLIGSIKKNDYSNAYLANSFSTNTIFKSIQATVRIPKLPVVSIGYYPSAQLMKLSEGVFTESYFYNLVGSLNHYYHAGSISANSTLTYTQFYNKTGDTTFVYNNTKNLFVNQSFFLRKFILQGGASIATGPEYNLYSANTDVQYNLNDIFSFGGGLKYNKQTTMVNGLIGYSCNISIKLWQLGNIQAMWDKGYMPGMNRQLVENNIGRVTYIKTF